MSPRRRRAGAVLLAGNVAVLGVMLMLRRGAEYDPLLDGWIASLPVMAPTLACAALAIRGGPHRVAAAWLAAGMACFAVGTVIYLTWTQLQADPPTPGSADFFYLAFYPCVFAAVLSLARGDRITTGKGLWLDGALGAAGGATALAAVLSPVLSSTAGDPADLLVGSAYSVADLLLFAMICGLLALRGLRSGSMWLWLAVGLAVFCAADVGYALRLAAGAFVAGTFLSVLWLSGLTIMAVAIWQPQRPPGINTGRSSAVLAVPILATLTAVVVLAWSTFGQDPVALGLATLTLTLATARTFVSFNELRRLSDARRQAVTDELTGLGNRRFLFEHGQERLDGAAEGERIALVLIDIDSFKEVNDTLGHHTGDELLRESARRLAARVSAPDLLVRLGSDEFALVIALAPSDNAREIAERILGRLCRPLVLGDTRLRVAASAGVAEREGGGVGVADLLRRADLAMYAAKAGSAGVELYDPQLDDANRTRLETIRDLDAALVNEQFVLHYQPKIDVTSGEMVGAEALVRWQHPTRGLLYPDTFLPLVEQSGLMASLTRLVLATAVGQLASWRASGLDIAVAVNLSASDLLDEDLVSRVEGLLTVNAVPAGALELEITESVLMTDPERARRVLLELRRLGLRIAVDDYGTGYCALAYLRDLPIDELKIDRSFIAHVTADPRSAAIVRSTIELSHALDLKVVAEGVEQRQALDELAAFGCDYAQGYHFSRPLPVEAFAAWARLRTPDPIASPRALTHS